MSDVTSGSAREHRDQARHCGGSGSINSGSSRTASRHGRPGRLRSISAAVEAGSFRCAEVNDVISGRMDMLNSINTALQNVSARPAENKPYRIRDLTPRSWEGNNEKAEFRSFMSDLHLWMQAWSNQGEKMLVIVEGVDKLDHNANAV